MLNTVTVNRRKLFILFAIALSAVWITAGVLSGFAARVGASPALARSITFSIAAILMYPYFSVRAEMKDAKIAPFWLWALVSTAGMFFAHFVISPLVVRLL